MEHNTAMVLGAIFSSGDPLKMAKLLCEAQDKSKDVEAKSLEVRSPEAKNLDSRS